MQFSRNNLPDETLIDLYRNLLLPGMTEEKMLLLQDEGKIGKWVSGIGHEATAVGATCALHADEWIMPLHHHTGVFTTRHMPLPALLTQRNGVAGGYSKGREPGFHFVNKDHFICSMSSHSGALLGMVNGMALACRLKKEEKVCLVFTGEDTTSEGNFYEALNVAAVWDLPVIFIIEKNGYGFRTNEEHRYGSLVERAKACGMEGLKIDGNNILTVYETVKGVRDYCIKNQKPYLIECSIFGMPGREEAVGEKYAPKEMFEVWIEKDPVKNYERFLVEEAILTNLEIAAIRKEIIGYIDDCLLTGGNGQLSLSVEDTSLAGKECGEVFAKKIVSNDSFAGKRQEKQPSALPVDKRGARFIDAIREALYQSMIAHPDLILMEQDNVAYDSGLNVTEGFANEFGKERVRHSPFLSESAIAGACLGLSLEGFKSVMEIRVAGLTPGFNPVINTLAKIHYQFGRNADVVIRVPAGAGAGHFYSQTNEAGFMHTPGLKVVYPSTPQDAKGLLIAAINDPNPVIFFEHEALYKSSKEFPAVFYEVEIGKARQVRSGNDISIITYGIGVIWATEYADAHPEISMEILDLRTLLPLDHKAIRTSVNNTGKALVLHEDTLTAGPGAEIAAWIAQNCFEFLDAPVMRCASIDTPPPFNIVSEKNFSAKSRLDEMIRKLVSY